MQDLDLYALPIALALVSAVAMPFVPVLPLGAVVLGRPAALKVRRLRQEGREIAFVEMGHVGPAAYYDHVREVISSEGTKGASYLYESIGPGTQEDRDRLARLTGRKLGSTDRQDYESSARKAGWMAQPQDTFRGLTGRPDVWADMNLSDVMAALPPDAGRPNDPGGTPKALAALGRTLRTVTRYDPVNLYLGLGERLFGGHVTRQRLRLGARSGIEDGPWRGYPKGAVGKLMEVRDRRLTDVVLATPGPLVVTYGAAHFPAFLHMLRQAGPVEVLGSEPLRFG